MKIFSSWGASRRYSRAKLRPAALGVVLALGGAHTGLQAQAQAPSPWQRAVAIAPNSVSEIRQTATDAAGNVYAAGLFDGTMQLGGTTLTSVGASDIFIAKWSAAGNLVWAQRVGSDDTDAVSGLVVSGQNIYVSGLFSGASIQFGSTTFSNTGFVDGFVAKITDTGAAPSFAWARQVTGPGDEYENVWGLAVVGTSVYIAGTYEGSAVTLGTTTLPSAGRSDAYVAKLTDAGTTANFVWTQRVGGPSWEDARRLVVTGTNVYLVGMFESSSLQIGNAVLTNMGDFDGFVAKFVDAGTTASVAWARQVSGPNREVVSGVAVAGSDVYIAGSFDGTAGWGTQSMTSAGGFDTFVAKLSDAGAWAWARRAGGSGPDFFNSLAATSTGVYAVGSFSGTAQFGSTTLSSTGSDDVYVTKLTGAGAFAWAHRGGSTGSDDGWAVVVAGNNVHVAGAVASSPAQFGTIAITGATSPNGSTAFWAMLPDALPQTTRASAAPGALAVWPNPARTHATVRLPAGSGPATVCLTDALGRTVRTQTVGAAPDAQVSVAGLAPGLYQVRVLAPGFSATQPLAVE